MRLEADTELIKKLNVMNEEPTSEYYYQEMKDLWETFETNHIRFKERGIKAAGVRARRAILALKKLTSKYRTQNQAESKEL